MKFLSVLLVALGAVVVESHHCGKHEVYKECGTCDQICNEDPVFCSEECKDSGCYCKEGYVRSSTGHCISESSCKRAQGPESSIQNAGKSADGPESSSRQNAGPSGPGQLGPSFSGAVPSRKSAAGPESSSTQNAGPGQLGLSFSGAVPSSAFRNGKSAAGPESSSRQNAGPGQLGPSFSGAVPSSASRNEKSASGPESSQRQFAGPGQLGPSFSGAVPSSASGKSAVQNDEVFDCGENEEYQRYGVGWQCEDYCGRGANACSYPAEGCYCKPGYIRSGPEYTAECIPEEDCPIAEYDVPPMPRNTRRRVVVENSDVVERSGPPQCQVNEEYNSCNGCDQFCYGEPIACAQDCSRPGCYCRKGFVRSFPGGICLKPENCASAQDESSAPAQSAQPSCPRNEVYQRNGVGSQCEDYCGRGANACAYPEDGCYCKPGYIRSNDRYKSRCILKDNCPRAQNNRPPVVENSGPPQCQVNEEYNSCTGCDQFCYGEPIACAQDCSRPGCYCRKGFVRSFPGGICLKPENCPRAQNNRPPPIVENSGPGSQSDAPSDTQASGYQCRPNERFQQNGVGPECEDYCGRGATACAYPKPGCYCQDGFVRAGPSNRTVCVRKSDCPVAMKCLKNEEYNTCGSQCPDSCDGKGRICTENCAESCFCKSGFIREHDDTETTRYKCIRKEQCPVP